MCEISRSSLPYFRRGALSALRFLFILALLKSLVEYFYVSDGTTALAELSILLPAPVGWHLVGENVGLFPILQATQSDFTEVYFAYDRSLEVDWENDAFVRWLLYVSFSRRVLVILAHKTKMDKTMASNVQIKKQAGVVSVGFKLGPQEKLAEAAEAVISVVVHPQIFQTQHPMFLSSM